MYGLGEALGNPTTYKPQPSPSSKPPAAAAAPSFLPASPSASATPTPPRSNTASSSSTPSPIEAPSPGLEPVTLPTNTPSSTPRPILSPPSTQVSLSDDAAWTVEVSGFDFGSIEWVTYYIRDASQHWHSVGPISRAPFTARLDWWTWNNAGPEVVTSHVQIWEGNRSRVVNDPGGWTRIDGQRVSPRGGLVALINSDDSLDLRYAPDRARDVIQAVQFWLRVGGRWSKIGEASRPDGGGPFEVISAAETASGNWKSDDTALSVDVVWPGGRQSVDPTPWVWRDHFGQAPLVPLPQNLQVTGAVTGQLTLGVNPHARASDNPSPTGNVPTWTRCAVFSSTFDTTTFFEADIVGIVDNKTYALSVINEDLGRHSIPGTYTMDMTGFTPIDVTFAATDGTARWLRARPSDSAAVVTFADRASGSINAHLVGGVDGGGQQPIDISGTWRCGGAGSVAATIPRLPAVAKATVTPPPSSAAPPTAAPPPPAAPPQPPAAGCYPFTNSGGCYRPGEFCRSSDHGALGRAADGEAIRCVNNDGWRWEPA